MQNQRLVDEIEKLLDRMADSSPEAIELLAGAVRDLSEAWAWLTDPAQSHGR